MKINELRLGNILSVAGINRLVSVCALFKTHFRCEDKDGMQFEESLRINYMPVPITEEWLLNFGFEKTMSWTYCIELTGNLKLVYYLGEKGWSIDFKDYSDFSELKYTHQLQNLYFALTGKELTLKYGTE